MGMSASQVRLLELTSRKNDIGFQLSVLANQKVALSKDSQKITRAYQEALNSKIFKWSNNNGASYIDLTYNNLMKPGLINTNKSVLLTDTSGRVVLDRSYLKFAQMISPNGSPGGDWDTNRSKILASILGIDEELITSELSSEQQIMDSQAKLDDKKAEEPSIKEFEESCIATLLDRWEYGDYTGKMGSEYYATDKTFEKNKTETLNYIDEYCNEFSEKLSKYFYGKEDVFKEAVENARKNAKTLVENSQSSSGIKHLDNGNFEFSYKNFFNTIFTTYAQEASLCYEKNSNDTMELPWIDVDDEKFAQWETNHAQWEAEYEAMQKEHDEFVAALSLQLEAVDESAINFYNVMFTAIAEKGWVYNEDVKDSEYLNQMLQNNMFTITSIDSTKLFDEKTKQIYKDYDYTMSIASNFSNIFEVRDSAEVAEAEAEYEYQKTLINSKESRIDTRMQNLETEQSAVNQMIQSIETQRNENIERNFTIMS